MHIHQPTKFFANPGWSFIYNVTLIEVAIGLLFYLVYGATDFLTSLHNLRIPVHFPFETNLPLWPAMTLVYVSLIPAFLLAKFIVRDKEVVKALAWTLVAETLIAGIFFILLPSETAYPVRGNLGVWERLYQLSDTANLTYNLVPSLHVTYTVTLAAAFAPFARKPLILLIWFWPISMAFATVLTHHHHIIDAVCGILFGAIMNRLIMNPYLVKQSTGLPSKLRWLEDETKVFTRKMMLPW